MRIIQIVGIPTTVIRYKYLFEWEKNNLYEYIYSHGFVISPELINGNKIIEIDISHRHLALSINNNKNNV